MGQQFHFFISLYKSKPRWSDLKICKKVKVVIWASGLGAITPFWEVESCSLETPATDYEISETNADIMDFMQPPKKTLMVYTDLLSTKELHGSRLYKKYTFNGNAINVSKIPCTIACAHSDGLESFQSYKTFWVKKRLE